MSQKILKLAKEFSIPATEYASQGNAILGIRDSGKTYTAMKAAEQLLDAGIPITVYDPVGVWKNLRVGVNGHKGYPVIVAGGDPSADIIITPENAVQIIRAAMRAGVSIIIDLYSPSLANKSKWIRIVQETIDVFMYENKEHGLRHVFIEEASEFIPQRIQPQQAKVYSSIERLARMGRNASVGMTIINQRAEEINKAILELCAIVFMHKQVGKNSLLSIKKWMDTFSVEGRGEILISDLPALKQGESIVLDTNSDFSFKKIKTFPRHTYHPSPEKGLPAKAVKSTVNISEFVKKLNQQLTPKPETKKENKQAPATGKISGAKSHTSPSPEILAAAKQRDDMIEKIKKYNEEYADFLSSLSSDLSSMQKSLDELSTATKRLSAIIKKAPAIKLSPMATRSLHQSAQVSADRAAAPAKSYQSYTSAANGVVVSDGNKMDGMRKMIKGVSMYGGVGITKGKLAVLCGMSPNSGTFQTYYRTLRADGTFIENGDLFLPSIRCSELAFDLPPLSTTKHELLNVWYGILGEGNGMTKILRSVASMDGRWVDTQAVLDDTGFSNSGTFQTYYRTLRAKGLIEMRKGQFKLSDNFNV